MKKWLCFVFMNVASALLFAQADTTLNQPLIHQENIRPMFPLNTDSIAIDSFFRQFGIQIDDAVNPELYVEIFQWYGTCYRYGGTDKGGVDCSGFTRAIFKKIYGIALPHSSSGMYERCRHLVAQDKKQEGDLVFFKIRKRRISHVGIYLQNNKFVHASTQAGVIISDLNEDYYRKYFYRFGRVR